MMLVIRDGKGNAMDEYEYEIVNKVNDNEMLVKRNGKIKRVFRIEDRWYTRTYNTYCRRYETTYLGY